MLIDLFGLMPFHLLLADIDLTDKSIFVVSLVIFLSCLRMISILQLLKIFGQFEIYLKKYNFIMSVTKACLILFFLGHWMTCSWHFVSLKVGNSDSISW